MQTSETIGALMAALATAQASIGGAIKGKVNPAFKSKYADLASVWEAWQAVGPANGLAVTQWNGGVIEGRVEITTMLAHKSGEWMRETALIPLGKADAQGYVSAVTYGRRCALSALAGIAPEDDDGNAAVRAPRPAAANSGADTGEAVNKDELAQIHAALDATGRDAARMCAHYKIDALPDLPAARFTEALDLASRPIKRAA